MDMLKNAASKMSGSGSTNQQTGQTGQSGMTGGSTGQMGSTGTTGTGQQDYGDKAFDAISKKAGHDFTPQQDEKITDGARAAYEKYSGAPVNQKYSN